MKSSNILFADKIDACEFQRCRINESGKQRHEEQEHIGVMCEEGMVCGAISQFSLFGFFTRKYVILRG